MSDQYFPPNKDGRDINVNLDLTGYETKEDLKILNVDTSLTGLKTEVDDLKDNVDEFQMSITDILIKKRRWISSKKLSRH